MSFPPPLSLLSYLLIPSSAIDSPLLLNCQPSEKPTFRAKLINFFSFFFFFFSLFPLCFCFYIPTSYINEYFSLCHISFYRHFPVTTLKSVSFEFFFFGWRGM